MKMNAYRNVTIDYREKRIMSSIVSSSLLLLLLLVASTPGAPGVVSVRMAAAFQSPVPGVTVTHRHHWRRQHSNLGTTTTATAGIRRLTPSSSSSLPSSSTLLYSSLTNRPTELPDSLVDAAAMAANVSTYMCVCVFIILSYMIREAGIYIIS
jgi:hypothetical protein